MIRGRLVVGGSALDALAVVAVTIVAGHVGRDPDVRMRREPRVLREVDDRRDDHAGEPDRGQDQRGQLACARDPPAEPERRSDARA
jgi:hypothetical protein